ncbi:MAG TPA: beta-ketoacyl synthase N-terminal-like domain-containing protein [Ohtaekwangia sp.]|nr:beta-ketoacyl synthase N-terminal-like domain-containing protein [Ohtaekwangia sp.]
MRLFINGMGNISPQQTWNDESALLHTFDYRGTMLQAILPPPGQWIPEGDLTTLNRLESMCVMAAHMALEKAGITSPDGIITGTGYGCQEVLAAILHQQTIGAADIDLPFTRSQYDTLGFQIARLLKCNVYNQTFSQSAFSFEHTLLDAMMLLDEGAVENMLVGGADEIIEESHLIQARAGMLRRKIASTRNLFTLPKRGTVVGEGAAYFVVSANQTKTTVAELKGLSLQYKPGPQALRDALEVFIREQGFIPQDIDLVLLGKSGDKLGDQFLNDLCKSTFPKSSIGLYKHLCGEYPVASAFALWLGARILKERHIPEAVTFKYFSRPVNNVLIFNSYLNTHHSFMLLKSCQDIL